MQTSIRRRNTPQVVHDANSPNCSVQQLIIYRKPSRYSVDLTQHYAGGVSIPQSAIFLEPNRQAPLARHGARWAVLLLHGFTAGPASVLPWGLALAEAGATVHIPLLAGHGTSVSDLAQTSAEQWRTDTQQALDRMFRDSFEYVAVGGLSMGGALALDAAAHRPVDATFVVNPALSFKPLDQLGVYLSPLLQHVVPTVGPLAGDIKKPGVIETAYDRTPVPAVEQLGRLFWSVRRNLRNIHGPVTLYQSPKDHIVPASTGKLLQQVIAPHLLTTVTLEHSYHVATLDYDAEKIQQDSITKLLALSGGYCAVK